MRQKLENLLSQVLQELHVSVPAITVDYPADSKFGDYSTNVALVAAKQAGKQPRELAEEISAKCKVQSAKLIEKVEVAGPGFINFWITDEYLIQKIGETGKIEEIGKPKRIIVEYAHPNTHKEMHIGHMRTLITGEAFARLLEAIGMSVFRANYQGDIGPHVARALYGVQKLMKEKGLSLEQIDTWTDKDKAHFLGDAYVLGNLDYEQHKEEIDGITKGLYERDKGFMPLYEITRKWSLDYYDDFYKRFYTKFDQLFFESDMAECGAKIIKDHIDKVFIRENGAVIFPGEKYGLHTRVFITQAGNPTYEAKDMCNAYKQYEAFPFDKTIHVVASEQKGYFQVVIKALELIDPEKFKGKKYHLPMGMVQLSDRKMSSRTGDILTVDWLIDEVKNRVQKLVSHEKLDPVEKDRTIEQIAIGAIKYSVLGVGALQDAKFDIAKSVSLDGNSGPYLQYTYARTQSVLKKGQGTRDKGQDEENTLSTIPYTLYPEERDLLRLLARFPEIVGEAAERYAPNILCTYLFDLAQAFNLFYQKYPILKADDEMKNMRLTLTAAVGETVKQGLHLLGIQAPERM